MLPSPGLKAAVLGGGAGGGGAAVTAGALLGGDLAAKALLAAAVVGGGMVGTAAIATPDEARPTSATTAQKPGHARPAAETKRLRRIARYVIARVARRRHRDRCAV